MNLAGHFSVPKQENFSNYRLTILAYLTAHSDIPEKAGHKSGKGNGIEKGENHGP